MESQSSRKSARRFCVLAYSADKDSAPQPNDTTIIALATSSTKGDCVIRFHPEWREVVQPSDHEYVESLFRDFKDRVRFDSEGLFQQLTALGVGPLVTLDSGSNLDEHPEYLGMTEKFTEL